MIHHNSFHFFAPIVKNEFGMRFFSYVLACSTLAKCKVSFMNIIIYSYQVIIKPNLVLGWELPILFTFQRVTRFCQPCLELTFCSCCQLLSLNWLLTLKNLNWLFNLQFDFSNSFSYHIVVSLLHLFKAFDILVHGLKGHF